MTTPRLICTVCISLCQAVVTSSFPLSIMVWFPIQFSRSVYMTCLYDIYLIHQCSVQHVRICAVGWCRVSSLHERNLRNVLSSMATNAFNALCIVWLVTFIDLFSLIKKIKFEQLKTKILTIILRRNTYAYWIKGGTMVWYLKLFWEI